MACRHMVRSRQAYYKGRYREPRAPAGAPGSVDGDGVAGPATEAGYAQAASPAAPAAARGGIKAGRHAQGVSVLLCLRH